MQFNDRQLFDNQATTLNVAVNASNKALLTIMMSNNVSDSSTESVLELGRSVVLVHPAYDRSRFVAIISSICYQRGTL